MNFNEKLQHIVNTNNSLLCVGLDVDQDKIPEFLFDKKSNPYLEFNKQIIDNTKNHICAYKINMAFYEALGKKGFEIIEKTIKYIPKEIVIILDGKRNDIGNTASKYAISLFEKLKTDAVTVNPYLGKDGITPFLKYKEKCSFILCKTSNPSAVEFQDLLVGKTPLYEQVAQKIKEWNKNHGNCGAVVGSTYPKELKKIREILGENIPILLPGVGKQGGDIEKTVKYGTNKKGEMAIINSSRGIIYKSKEHDFAEKAGATSISLQKEISKYR